MTCCESQGDLGHPFQDLSNVPSDTYLPGIQSQTAARKALSKAHFFPHRCNYSTEVS